MFPFDDVIMNKCMHNRVRGFLAQEFSDSPDVVEMIVGILAPTHIYDTRGIWVNITNLGWKIILSVTSLHVWKRIGVMVCKKLAPPNLTFPEDL